MSVKVYTDEQMFPFRKDRGILPRDLTTKDEYKARKDATLKNEIRRGEPNLLGRRRVTTREEAHKYMYWRLSSITRYNLPRDVGERLDISSDAKLVYAFLNSFTTSPRLYRTEIAGMCGLSLDAVSRALFDLQQVGLIRVKKRWYAKNRSAPSVFVRLPRYSRFKTGEISPMMKNNIKVVEEQIRARFKL